MKKLMYTFLLLGVLTLTACASSNQASGTFDYLTDSEQNEVAAAKKELSFDEFNKATEEANQETAKLNDTEEVDLFSGTTYDAYLLTRANLSEESFKQAKDDAIFAAELDYDAYKSVSDALVNREAYQKTMVKDGENDNYGAYAAKSVQYLTAEGSPK